MVNRIYDLYDDLEKHRIMLSFKGVLSPELIGAILNLVEHRMNASEPDHRVRKRVFNVVMECLQNLYHHNNRISDPNGAPLPPDERQGVVMIAHDVSGYSVLTGNFMAQSEVEELKARLDQVNGCKPEQLRELYQSRLSDGKFTRTGGGGLGLIDIARRSGQKLEYGFVPLDNNNAFFSLNVNVTT
ncbi:MAG: SiaB family protein kinase [Flavobacteriales bacterium]|nr:SiaB family protein kinase [Flavobacteriales bacterium]MCL4283090.1 SiaB family protein kinase [Flavobacteriales bacterium]